MKTEKLMKNTLLIIAILAFALVGCEDTMQSSSKTITLSTGIKLKLDKIPNKCNSSGYVIVATYYIPSDQKFVNFKQFELSWRGQKYYEDYEGQITTRKRTEGDGYDTYTIDTGAQFEAACSPAITIIEEKPFGEK